MPRSPSYLAGIRKLAKDGSWVYGRRYSPSTIRGPLRELSVATERNVIIEIDQVSDLSSLRITSPLRFGDLMIKNGNKQLIRILARPDCHHAGRIDFVEHGDVGVHLVGGGERRRFQLQDGPLVRLGLGAL